jgi:REP element-mobilizing transposase RayT
MKYDPDRHHRRSIRLPNHNYAASGLYFITICANECECLFGEIIAGKMQLNANGEIVAQEWLKSQSIRAEITLDTWVVMPNHFHGIVAINADKIIPDNIAGAFGQTPPSSDRSPRIPVNRAKSLSRLISGFKSSVTKQINLLREMPGVPVWQRNYYEHIIRNPQALLNIRHYVENNPLNWTADQLHPVNIDIPNIPNHHSPHDVSP